MIKDANKPSHHKLSEKFSLLLDSAINKLCQYPLWGPVFVPILIPLKHISEFFIWFMFVVIAGQLGTIINVINRVVFLDWELSVALCPESAAGNFYTYALVLCASLLGPLFIRYKNDQKPLFRTIGMVYITIMVFFLLFCSIFFSFSSLSHQANEYLFLSSSQVSLDTKQFIFLLVSIVLAIYSFGLTLMAEYKEGIALDDDYNKKEDRLVSEMSDDLSSVDNDGNGIQL